MKIDQDLRQAIKSAERVQTKNLNWVEKRNAEKRAVADLFARKPALAKKINKAIAAVKKAEAARKVASEVIHAAGLSCSDLQITDKELFRKAGGQLAGGQAWTSDQAIAELAAASPKDAPAILAKYGIKWE